MMTAPRTCGGCTACCSVLPVKELKLRAYQRCPKLTDVFHKAGSGCGIYPSRPYSCKTWQCLWLKDTGLPDELRPDRSGVIFDELVDLVRINGQELPAAQVWARPGAEDAWNDARVGGVIAGLVGKGLVVLWRTKGTGDHQQDAFAILRNPITGRLERTVNGPASSDMGTDAERLIRAGEVAERLGIMP